MLQSYINKYQCIQLKDDQIEEDELIDRLRQEKELRDKTLLLKNKINTQKKEFEKNNQKIVNQYMKNNQMKLAYDFNGQYIIGRPILKKSTNDVKLVPSLQVKVLQQELRVQKIPHNPPTQPALVINQSIQRSRKKDNHKKKQETPIPLIQIVDKSKDGVRSLLKEKITIKSQKLEEIITDTSRQQYSPTSIEQSNNLLKKIQISTTNNNVIRPYSSSPTSQQIHQLNEDQLKILRRPASSRKRQIAALPDAAKILCEYIDLPKPIRRFSDLNKKQPLVKKPENQISIKNNILYCQLFEEI